MSLESLRKKILVIDDEEEICDLMQGWLTHLGYDVTTATNGDDGLWKAKTEKPDLPIFRSSQELQRNTIYTKIKFNTMPIKILDSSYTARNESIVVSVPAPAINGKASGTMEPVPLASGSSFINTIPKIISKAIMNITIEPAMAKEPTSKPKSVSID